MENALLMLLLRLSVSFLLMSISFIGIAAPKDTPQKIQLDFIGGYYKNGEYLCYTEPCFSIHRGTEAAIAKIRPFEMREWLPRRGSKDSCQSAYTEILTEKSLSPVKLYKQGSCSYVVEGSWLDSYNNEAIDDISTIAIDQRISLQEAHHYGGENWSRKKRMEFAYSKLNLVPVSMEQKKVRNGRSASSWMPQDKTRWCDYIVHREVVAREFKLRIPRHEKEHDKKIKMLYCKY